MRPLPFWLLPLGALLWLGALMLAPLGLHRTAGALPALATYQASSLLCHQRPERSFRIADVQMPVCGRCFGLYASGAIGALGAWILRTRRAAPAASTTKVVLAAAAIPIALSVGLEWLGVIEGSNVSRFLSAFPLGAAAGWLLQRVATEQSASHFSSAAMGVDPRLRGISGDPRDPRLR
jgi:uncharacterized membrane protein